MSVVQTAHGVRVVVSVRPEGQKQHILEVAQRQCAAAGGDTVTLSAIALAAGVRPHLIYHHFGSKAGLLQALLTECTSDGEETRIV